MTPAHSIVCGGGWHKRTIEARPKTRQVGFCAVAWLLVAGMGALLFNGDVTELDLFLVVFGGLAIAIEVILVIITALLFCLEALEEIVVVDQNADWDLHNLY